MVPVNTSGLSRDGSETSRSQLSALPRPKWRRLSTDDSKPRVGCCSSSCVAPGIDHEPNLVRAILQIHAPRFPRELAFRLLQAKLNQMKEAERDKELAAMYGSKGEIAFGSQIRSYVMHPYQMVKDHRTNYEVGNIQAVLDGEIDGFIEEYLRSRGAAKK